MLNSISFGQHGLGVLDSSFYSCLLLTSQASWIDNKIIEKHLNERQNFCSSNWLSAGNFFHSQINVFFTMGSVIRGLFSIFFCLVVILFYAHVKSENKNYKLALIKLNVEHWTLNTKPLNIMTKMNKPSQTDHLNEFIFNWNCMAHTIQPNRK